MTPSIYLAYQFSGTVLQSIANQIQAARDAELPLTNYWANLSIPTALDVDGTLNFVGYLCGYPRPLVSSVFFSTNIFTFADSTLGLQTGRYDIGFADANNPGLGGGSFDTASPLSTNVMPAFWYQSILPQAAKLKSSGLTLAMIDSLAEWANTTGGGTGYKISFATYKDILISFITHIDPRSLAIVNLLFTAYQTAPEVSASSP